MRNCDLLLAVVLTTTAIAGFAQGESLTPLSTRPVPEAMRSMRKVDGLNEHFIYDYLPQVLPIVDDFSADRTRKRWAQAADAGVTLEETHYHLEVAGVSSPAMAYNTDTTFLYVTDTSGAVDVTTRTPLLDVTVTVYDLSVYPPTSTEVQGWPPYNILDTITTGVTPDTLDFVAPDLVQDSLLVYSVPANTETYTNPDNSVVPLILWEDDDVYINGTYPIDPPTIGVATFDGLDRTGYPYNFLQYTAHGVADHLTSVDIDLEFNASDSIYLSFFYQPQGLSGDNNVQAIDSLVLEFWSPTAQFWYKAWSTPYLALQPFEQVLVPITNALFLENGFKFRFLNYATLSGSFDHWHLDYVRLGTQRTFDDTRLIDVAYVYPEASLLQTYTSVPFHKFDDAPGSYMAQSVTMPLKNLDDQDRFITYGMLAKEENAAPVSLFTNGLSGSGNASTTLATLHPVNSAPNNFIYDPALSTDAAFWRVKFWRTNTMPDINLYNDTVTFIQEISNYMSYDDGSAEMGYGLNVEGARVAYRFDIVGGDSLRAVRMYFNPQANDPQSSDPPLDGSFLITVWSDLTPPAAIIHQNFTYSSPEYRLDGINHFVEYPLDSTIYVQGTFYIGWVQNNVRMNLGFDRNRNNQNKIFYSTSAAGSFSNTTFEGSLMMRPVFVAATDPFASVEEGPSTSSDHQLVLVPNPASDAVLIRFEGATPGSMVQCLDATGRVVKQELWQDGQAMAVGDLNAGMYIVRLIDHAGSPLAQERMMIQR